MEHHKSDVRQAASCGTSGDDPACFLRELRQLRYGAGLGRAELAARAHYPYDSISAAEAGPALPDLPVLSAYVRGCGGTTEEWEERWRSLTSSPAQQQLLPTRPAGHSAAATAGARIGSISPVAESPDPTAVKKALDRMAAEMSATRPVAARAAATTAAGGSRPPAPTRTASTRTAAARADQLAGDGQPAINVPAPARAADSGLPPGQVQAADQAGDQAADQATAPATALAAASPAAATGTAVSAAAGTAGAGTAGAEGPAAETAAAEPAATASAKQSWLVTGILSPGRSRITVAALIAVVICVLVAVLA